MTKSSSLAPHFVWAATLFWSTLQVGCTLILQPDASQCRSNDDCARFQGSVCNLATNVCVPVRKDPQNTDGAALKDAGAGGRSSDASEADLLAQGAKGDPCAGTSKPLVTVEGDISVNDVLTCDKDYLLVGIVFIKSGVTLTINAGTTIHGDKTTKGTLVVQPGGRLVAVGTAAAPIVFTSQLSDSVRMAGDWGGLILLGHAPVNVAKPTIEGILEGGEYGGDDPDDSSGELKYVRIEYSGTKIGPNNEINGLTLGGVGRGTTIDFVQVRMTTDDCFEFFGGTVNAKHLICQKNGDDGFDWDNGYRGKLQFLALQQDPEVVDETNGFEGDNDATGSQNTPISAPTIYNATLCGKGRDVDKQQYGLLLRRSTQGVLRNLVVSGFEAGIDVRDANTMLDLGSATFFGNVPKTFAYEEDNRDTDVYKDDDLGFDENAWLAMPTHKILSVDPGIDCFNQAVLNLAPKTPLTASAEPPPNDGFFDSTANFMGAFRDQSDNWAKGNWVVWRAR